jgi:hypothetical protein
MNVKHAMMPVQSDIPFLPKGLVTAFSCSRGTENASTTMVVRKFKSSCGNVLEVHVTQKNGFIRSIKPVYSCQPNCQQCEDRIAKIRELLLAEHKKY